MPTATFPGGTHSFISHTNGEVIQTADVDALETEVTALENFLAGWGTSTPLLAQIQGGYAPLDTYGFASPVADGVGGAPIGFQSGWQNWVNTINGTGMYYGMTYARYGRVVQIRGEVSYEGGGAVLMYLPPSMTPINTQVFPVMVDTSQGYYCGGLRIVGSRDNNDGTYVNYDGAHPVYAAGAMIMIGIISSSGYPGTSYMPGFNGNSRIWINATYLLNGM